MIKNFNLRYRDLAASCSHVHPIVSLYRKGFLEEKLLESANKSIKYRTSEVFFDDFGYDKELAHFFLQVRNALEPGQKPGLTVVAG